MVASESCRQQPDNLSTGVVRESGNDIDVAELDDVFVRRDLFEGKYAPDLEQQRLFELETNGNQRWDREVIKEELNDLKPDIANVKVEL